MKDCQQRYPRMIMDLSKLRKNIEHIVQACGEHGVGVTAVTKVLCAHPAAAEVLIEAGVDNLGDSRLKNLRRLRDSDVDAELMLLRLPRMSRADDVVQLADVSLNSEVATIESLDEAACANNVTHGVVLMVDVGDLREGVWIDDVASLAEAADQAENVNVVGVGTNLACYGGVTPSVRNMEKLLQARSVAAEVLGFEPEVVSGGNSANWDLLKSGQLPEGINNLRIGEAIFLGNETVRRAKIDPMHDDVFQVEAEVIELQRKPSVPVGDIGQDAFGQTPTFEDRGRHRRAIVALGRQDVVPDGLLPRMNSAEIIGASSDHMILDVEDVQNPVEVGDVLTFTVRGYSALLALSTSQYVHKQEVRLD